MSETAESFAVISPETPAVLTTFKPGARAGRPIEFRDFDAMIAFFEVAAEVDAPTLAQSFARARCVRRRRKKNLSGWLLIALVVGRPRVPLAATSERLALLGVPHFGWELDDGERGRPGPYVLLADVLARTWTDLEHAARQLAKLAGVRPNSRSWLDATFPLPRPGRARATPVFESLCSGWLPSVPQQPDATCARGERGAAARS